MNMVDSDAVQYVPLTCCVAGGIAVPDAKIPVKAYMQAC